MTYPGVRKDGYHISAALWSFSQSDYLFLAKDPDKRNRERYNEIGGFGFDSKEVERICLTLKRYQFLYLERDAS